MKVIVKLFVFLIGVAMICWGGLLIALGFVGETATARDVQVRRTGGDRGDSSPNRYSYSISYEFVTKAGNVQTGHSQGIGDSISVKTPKRICYLPAYPFLNAPEGDCGVGGYSLIMVGIGGVVLWSFTRKARSGAPRRKVKSRGKSSGAAKTIAPIESGSPDRSKAAGEWLSKYRRHSRIYAWGFFIVVVIGIGIAVRVGLEEWGTEWFAATGFAALVTWLLAIYSRREAESSWSGVVASKEIQERRDTRDPDGNTTRTSYVVFVETDRGKRKKIRVNPSVFDSYREGARVRKFAGLAFALPEEMDGDTALCPVCGRLLEGATETCSSCRAPVFRFEDFEAAFRS